MQAVADRFQLAKVGGRPRIGRSGMGSRFDKKAEQIREWAFRWQDEKKCKVGISTPSHSLDTCHGCIVREGNKAFTSNADTI